MVHVSKTTLMDHLRRQHKADDVKGRKPIREAEPSTEIKRFAFGDKNIVSRRRKYPASRRNYRKHSRYLLLHIREMWGCSEYDKYKSEPDRRRRISPPPFKARESALEGPSLSPTAAATQAFPDRWPRLRKRTYLAVANLRRPGHRGGVNISVKDCWHKRTRFEN